MHHDYCLLTGGLERALYRVARKHVGQQRGGCTCRLEVLREKTGSDATPKEFARMVRKIIEADQLPEYTMTITKTTEGAPAALFELRGAAEAAAPHAKLERWEEARVGEEGGSQGKARWWALQYKKNKARTRKCEK